MGQYIDVAYLQSVVGEQALRTIVSARLASGTSFALDDPEVEASIETAIVTAEATAEAKLGRRFNPGELDGLQDEVVIREAIARIAAYKLAPSLMPRSDELRADNDRACSLLCAISKRELAAGRSDPDPPPDHSALIATTQQRGLDALARF